VAMGASPVAARAESNCRLLSMVILSRYPLGDRDIMASIAPSG
jgi:hypothetical protein